MFHTHIVPQAKLEYGVIFEIYINLSLQFHVSEEGCNHLWLLIQMRYSSLAGYGQGFCFLVL
jgi:hypothetical protein